MGSRYKRFTTQDIQRLQGLPVTRKGMKLDNPEYRIYVDIADHMAQFYPQHILHFDYGSGLKMTKRQAGMQARINRPNYPDCFLATPNKKYHGLYMEIKTKENNPYKRNGSLKSDNHIRSQAAMLDDLNAKGYYAVFGVGYEKSILLITAYLSYDLFPDRLPKPIIHFKN